MSEWHSNMDEAPKDGTVIRIFSEAWRELDDPAPRARWEDECGWCFWDNNTWEPLYEGEEILPLVWIPVETLPPPPKE